MNQKTRQQAIEILSSSEAVICTGLIEKFVWANTTEPKYKVGDAVIICDPRTSIHRYRWKDGRREEDSRRVQYAIGKVTEVRRLLGDRTFQYTVEYETDLEGWEVNGKGVTSHKAFPLESAVLPADAYRPTLWSELSGK